MSGVASIRFEGNRAACEALLPQAKKLLYSVRTVREKAGVTTFAAVRKLGDNAYAYALSSGTVDILYVSANVEAVYETYEPVFQSQESYVPPSLYSGLAFNPHMVDENTVLPNGTAERAGLMYTFAPTLDCRTYINGRSNNAQTLVPGPQPVRRLALEPHPMFPEAQSRSPVRVAPQCAYLKPSLYSGTMAKVIQIMQGYGKMSTSSLHPNSAADAYGKLVKENGFKIQYDHRFSRTHGVYRTAVKKKLWLIEISAARGVLAMPLPEFPPPPGSKSLKEYFELKADSEDMTAIFDDLGMLPTGESFPSGQALEARINKGTVLRLLTAEDLEPFYKCSPYASTQGWVFNPRGNEAHNTGYYYGDDEVQRGVHYQISIQIGELLEDREPNTPIAIGSAHLIKQGEGLLYAPSGKIARYLPFKYHEPLLPESGLLSHDAGLPPYIYNRVANQKCDTPMFVAFHGEALVVARYYRNPKSAIYNEIVDTFEGCLYSGSWYREQSTGTRSFPTMMYLNIQDDRAVLQGSYSRYDMTSADMGFTPCTISDFEEDLSWSVSTRSKIFKETLVNYTESGQRMNAIVAVPEGSRQGFYYAFGTTLGSVSRTNTVQYTTLRDPHTYYNFRRFPSAQIDPVPAGATAAKCSCIGPNCEQANIPITRRKRVYLQMANTPCSDYADGGDFLPQCADVESICRGSVRIPATSVTNTTPPPYNGFLRYYDDSGLGAVNLVLTHSSFENRWEMPSPDPDFGLMQNITATYSTMNDLGAESRQYMTELLQSGGIHKREGVFCTTHTDGSMTYVGVNGV